MSQHSEIQWTDSTVNPVMGCSAPCELRPDPNKVRIYAQNFFKAEFPQVEKAVIEETVSGLIGNHNASEIYQLRDRLAGEVIASINKKPGDVNAVKAITKRLKQKFDEIFICYAHQQHFIRGRDITNPDKTTNPGYATQFEIVTKFPGRVASAAMDSDLFGKPHKQKPWLDFLPRLIFVSDMADALSKEVSFEYLKKEIVDVVATKRGSQHIWLWLTKMPKRMMEFGNWLQAQGGAWPDNLVAMTTVTDQKTAIRAEQLKEVPARFKGLSVEPLWEDVILPLDGIDWCIVGGQSGPGSKRFDLAWAENLHSQCLVSGTAFFMKQLGARPEANGEPVAHKDRHGGDWNEWPVHLRVREVPEGFRSLRIEMTGQVAAGIT